MLAGDQHGRPSWTARAWSSPRRAHRAQPHAGRGRDRLRAHQLHSLRPQPHRACCCRGTLSISSLGAVDSIQLVARKPLEEDPTVALTPQSATAWLCSRPSSSCAIGQEVSTRSWRDPVSGGPGGDDAVLLIGDQGLEALSLPRPGYHLPRPGGSLAGVDRAAHGLCGLGGAGGFRPRQRRRAQAVEEELVALHGLRSRASVRGGGFGRGAIRFDRDVPDPLFRPVCATTSPPSIREGLLRFYELAHEAGELEEVPRAPLHRRGAAEGGSGERARRAEAGPAAGAARAGGAAGPADAAPEGGS